MTSPHYLLEVVLIGGKHEYYRRIGLRAAQAWAATLRTMKSVRSVTVFKSTEL